MFERVMNFEDSGRFSTMLVEQYRMNSAIMQWSSQFMYDGRLVAH
jgi:ATP-dependent RNA/DNA helicase IGHMBP2